MATIHTEKVGKATLAPAAAASYARMLRAGMPQAGYVNSYRSFAEQERLYKLYLAGKGNLAAKPGKSRHNFGDAMDITTGSAQQRWLSAGDTYNKVGGGKTRANSYGWVRDVKSEPWHFRYLASQDASAKPDEGTRKLQRALNARGAKLTVDGVYGLASYRALVAFQTASKLTADGVDGPKTWAALSDTPPPVEEPKAPQEPAAVVLRVATFNCLDPRFGGSTTTARGEALAKVIADTGAQLVALTECPDDDRSKRLRTRIRSALPGGEARWKVWTDLDMIPGVAILFDTKAVLTGPGKKVTRIPFGTAKYHGGILAEFTAGGVPIIFGAYHLQPNSLVSDAVQVKQVRQVADAAAKSGRVAIIAGDGVNSNDWLPGWTDAHKARTADVPTYKTARPDRIHVLTVQPDGYLVTVDAYAVRVTTASDHNAPYAELAIRRPATN